MAGCEDQLGREIKIIKTIPGPNLRNEFYTGK
jgi:hypothetical protein